MTDETFHGVPDTSERVVLGALLDEGPEFQAQALPALNEYSFTDFTHQTVFLAISTLARLDEEIDLPSVTQAMLEAGTLQKVGGGGTLARLVNEAVEVRSPRVHLQRIVEATQKRQVQAAMRTLLGADASADTVFADLDTLRDQGADMSVTLPSLSGQLGQYQHELERRRDMETPLVGVPTGWRDLDGEYHPNNPDRTRIGYLPGGFERGHLILLAARPGEGKTTGLVDFIRSACKTGKGVVFFSNEMPAAEIIELLVCAEVGTMKRDRYKWPKDIPPHGWDRIAEAQAEIAEWNLIIDDQADTLEDQRRVLAVARMHFQTRGTDLAIAFQDFIQRMRTKGGRGNKAQHEELGTFSAGLKDMAKQMNIAVVAAAQLNRGAVETERLPRADDLRGSGSLEQDADVIIGFHRPFATQGAEQGHSAMDLQVVMLKVRHGASGQVFERAFLGELAQTREPAPRGMLTEPQGA